MYRSSHDSVVALSSTTQPIYHIHREKPASLGYCKMPLCDRSKCVPYSRRCTTRRMNRVCRMGASSRGIGEQMVNASDPLGHDEHIDSAKPLRLASRYFAESLYPEANVFPKGQTLPPRSCCSGNRQMQTVSSLGSGGDFLRSARCFVRFHRRLSPDNEDGVHGTPLPIKRADGGT